MDALIVYEDKAALDREGNLYIGTAFSNEALSGYLQHFDNLILLMRHADVSPDDTEKLAGMNKITDPRVSVVFLPNPTASIKNFLNLRLRREYRKTVIENITPDRAVIIRVPSRSGTIAAKYCDKIGKTYLAETIGCPWDSLWNHSLRGKLFAPFSWLNLRRTMRHAPYSVYVTSEFLQRRYPTKGITAAISDVELQPMSDDVLEKRLEKIKAHTGKFKIATGGALVAYKGQQFVIEALAKLKAQGNTNFEYHLAGSGDEPALKALADQMGVADQVIFEGRLSHDQMFAWLDEMDLYIQPSLQEGLPRAVVEAMSRGLPCFVSRTGGMPELVGEDDIFARKSINEIAECFLTINTEKMEKMAISNFNKAKEFQKELLAKKRFDFYAQFAKAAGDNEK